MVPPKIVSSGVTEWPISVNQSSAVMCAICGNTTPIENAKTGAHYADGRQAFACSDHAQSTSKWMVAWALFADEQNEGRDDA